MTGSRTDRGICPTKSSIAVKRKISPDRKTSPDKRSKKGPPENVNSQSSTILESKNVGLSTKGNIQGSSIGRSTSSREKRKKGNLLSEERYARSEDGEGHVSDGVCEGYVREAEEQTEITLGISGKPQINASNGLLSRGAWSRPITPSMRAA